jgi:hypothetical protein
MKAKNCTKDDLRNALDILNVKYEGNIKFKSMEMRGRQIQFTLTVCDSRGKGSRKSIQGRRISAACWHAHGDFFDILIDLNPEAEIKTGMDNLNNGIINRWGGNWFDKNIGSVAFPAAFPFYFSESCDCEGRG